MNPVRMTHPRHGAMHVYDEDQQQIHEKLGWKVQTEAELQEVLEAKRRRLAIARGESEVEPASVTPIEKAPRGRPRKAA